MRYYVCLEDTGRLVVVEGWDEVEKLQRDHPGERLSVFEEAKMMTSMEQQSKRNELKSIDGWELNG